MIDTIITGLWGYPENYKGNVLIVIGSNLEDNSEFFEDVRVAESHSNKYSMSYENVDILKPVNIKSCIIEFSYKNEKNEKNEIMK